MSKKQQSPQKILIEVLKGVNPIAHMFILDSLSKNIDIVLTHQEELRENFKNTLIDGDAWINAAEQLKVALGWEEKPTKQAIQAGDEPINKTI
jgi:hypothetical protein